MSQHILIIDDDETMLHTTRALLEYEGYSVSTWSSPFGASKVINEKRPSLVLLDVNMPGLSGDVLVGVLERNGCVEGVPVVFYSSNDEDSLRRSVARLGVAGYICKGDPVGLSYGIRKHLR